MVSLARFMEQPKWTGLGVALGRARVDVRVLEEGIVRFQASSLLSRQAGMRVSFYLVGDLLIDTGFSHASRSVVEALAARTIRAIACTHHHEDHTGNAGALARAHDACPVFLHRPLERWGEGVGNLLPYRQLYWGPVGEYTAQEMPDELALERRLEVIPTPGHSRTHVVLYERQAGVVFSGDLLVSTGATALMTERGIVMVCSGCIGSSSKPAVVLVTVKVKS